MSKALNIHVLVLNKSWKPIGHTTVKDALEDMNSSKYPKKALKIEYMKDDQGNFDFSAPTEVIPLSWKEWATLSPREFDEDSIIIKCPSRRSEQQREISITIMEESVYGRVTWFLIKVLP